MGWMERPIECGATPAAASPCILDAKMHLSHERAEKEREKVSGMRVTISWIRHAAFSLAAGAREPREE
jgi:hypothetical protein